MFRLSYRPRRRRTGGSPGILVWRGCLEHSLLLFEGFWGESGPTNRAIEIGELREEIRLVNFNPDFHFKNKSLAFQFNPKTKKDLE